MERQAEALPGRARLGKAGENLEKETEVLSNLKALEREGRKQLASLRRQKRESRARREHTTLVREHLQARKSGEYQDPTTELFRLNRFLDRDDLSPEERKAFSARRRTVLSIKMRLES